MIEQTRKRLGFVCMNREELLQVFSSNSINSIARQSIVKEARKALKYSKKTSDAAILKTLEADYKRIRNDFEVKNNEVLKGLLENESPGVIVEQSEGRFLKLVVSLHELRQQKNAVRLSFEIKHRIAEAEIALTLMKLLFGKAEIEDIIESRLETKKTAL